MDITVLGSGGNSPIPMPTCECRVCVEAREKGEPYARRGNSLFIHDENILIDAPELVWHSLNRERIEQVDYVLLSHYHADHTLGLRTLQSLGGEGVPITDFVGEQPTLIASEETYDRVIADSEFFEHLTDHWAETERLEDGEELTIGELELTHIAAPIEAGGPTDISGFLFEHEGKTAFISPDENRHFELNQLPELDLWIKETGYFREDPEGNPLVTEQAEQGGLTHEMTFEESLAQVRAVEPERTVFTEIEELFRRSFDDYQRLETEHEEHIRFAYDGMELQVTR